MKSTFFLSLWLAFHFRILLTEPRAFRGSLCIRLRACAGVHERAHALTSAAEVLLIDLDHELPINISEHAAVHPVRHKPAEKEGKKVQTVISR